jgi:hypothetical protein
MKLINRKNFFTIVCISFTMIVTGKLIFEKIIGHFDRYYSDNIFICLGFCVVIPAVLSVHYYLQRFPLLPVLIGQYLVVLGATVLFVLTVDKISGTDTNAMWQMIVSVTIPYVLGAAYYYFMFFRQIGKANDILAELKNEG